MLNRLKKLEKINKIKNGYSLMSFEFYGRRPNIYKLIRGIIHQDITEGEFTRLESEAADIKKFKFKITTV